VFEHSVFEVKAKAKAKDLEAKVEASDLCDECDEGQSSMGYTKGVESTV